MGVNRLAEGGIVSFAQDAQASLEVEITMASKVRAGPDHEEASRHYRKPARFWPRRAGFGCWLRNLVIGRTHNWDAGFDPAMQNSFGG